MRKVNTNDIDELTWSSPSGKFSGAGKQIAEALGRKPTSTDLKELHPFDVELPRAPLAQKRHSVRTASPLASRSKASLRSSSVTEPLTSRSTGSRPARQSAIERGMSRCATDEPMKLPRSVFSPTTSGP